MAEGLATLLENAAKKGDGIHYLCQTAEWNGFQSYESLKRDSERLCSGLRSLGLKPQDRIVFQLAKSQEIVTAFWACVMGGFIAVPINMPRTYREFTGQLGKIKHCIELVEALVLTNRTNLDEIVERMPRVGNMTAKPRAHAIEDLMGNAGEQREEQSIEYYTHKPDDLVLLMLTSGSTGNSKAVMLRHRNLMASIEGKKKQFSMNGDDVTLNWISLDHVAGMIDCHLIPTMLGIKQLQVEPGLMMSDPLVFMELVHKEKVTFSFAPNFMFPRWMDELANNSRGNAGKEWNLSSLRVLISGGEPVVIRTACAFLEKFAPLGLRPTCVVPGFGMTETCAGCIFGMDFPTYDNGLNNLKENEFGCLGYPIEGVQMRIVDDDGKVVNAGEVGQLQISGSVVFGGYYANDEATKGAFMDGWFDTGDRGFLDVTGRLTLAGRSKDTIIINGVNYYSHEVEATVEEVEGVCKSWVVAVALKAPHADTEQLAIFYNPEAAGDKTQEELDHTVDYDLIVNVREEVIKQWGVRPSVILPLAKEELPKSSLGKISRQRLRALYTWGRYQGLAQKVEALARESVDFVPPENGTEGTLRKIWAKVLQLPEEHISVVQHFFDLGGTSIDIIALKSAIDRQWSMDMPITWVFQYPSIRAFAGKLDEGQKGSTYSPVIPLQTTGKNTPIFVVHPGVGEVLIFVELAKMFRGDRPFYALRARGFNDGEPYFGSMDEMASVYTEAIRKVQPTGPYLLAGYSYGGAVAYCIGKKLEALGAQVPFVGIFNLPPHIKKRMHEIDFTGGLMNFSMFVDFFSKEKCNEIGESIKHLSHDDQIRWVLDHAPQTRVKELALSHAKFKRWLDVTQSLINCGKGYDPEGNVDEVTVFHAIPFRGTKAEWLDMLQGWDQFVRTGVRFVEVAGYHYTLMSPENVRSFSKKLKAELARAEAKLAH